MVKISAFHHKKWPSCGPIFFFIEMARKSCILKVIFHSKWLKLPPYMGSFKKTCPVHFLSYKKCQCSFSTFQITLLFMFHSKKWNKILKNRFDLNKIGSDALTEKGRLSGASLSEQMFEHISIISNNFCISFSALDRRNIQDCRL